jgi:iron(III) transport system substrate-binding protein
VLVDRKFDTRKRAPNPAEVARWEILRDLYTRFRATDDPRAFTSRIDLFFGGGDYDHTKAFRAGPDRGPVAHQRAARRPVHGGGRHGVDPGQNRRRDVAHRHLLRQRGQHLRHLLQPGPVARPRHHQPPRQWSDLADVRYFRQIGLADPTKSGSFAKAFELIIHQQCYEAVRAAGFSDDDINRHEAAIRAAKRPAGEMPEGVPAAYQAAVEEGWLQRHPAGSAHRRQRALLHRLGQQGAH